MKKIISLFLCTLCITFGSFAQHEGKSKKVKKNRKSKIEQKATEQTLQADTTDPICKMAVSKGSKQVSIYKGKQVGFCSIVCKEMFDKNPKKYASHHH
jgi:YHS domain-containing protein